jgi:hypothetical protein
MTTKIENKNEVFVKAMSSEQAVEILPCKLDKTIEGSEAFNKQVKAVDAAFEKPSMAYRYSSEYTPKRRELEQAYIKAEDVFKADCARLDLQRSKLLEQVHTDHATTLLKSSNLSITKVPGTSRVAVKLHNEAVYKLMRTACEILIPGIKESSHRSAIWRDDRSDYNLRAINRAIAANEVKAAKLWPRYLALAANKSKLTTPPMVKSPLRPAKGAR